MIARSQSTSSTTLGIRVEAGEDIEDQHVYIADADGKAYIGDVSDYAKIPQGWVEGFVANGATATVVPFGRVTPQQSMLIQTELYAGRDGKLTWYQSAGVWEPAHGLQAGNWIVYAGRSPDGTTVNANFLNQVVTQYQ